MDAQPSPAWPVGGGESAARIREHDWAGGPLGPIRGWPERLKVVVEMVLASPLVSTLVCGPDRLLIYNDAAARLYGDRRPKALGRPVPETFPEGWASVEPLYRRVFAGEAVQVEAQPLDVRGAGADTLFDAWLTPVRDEAGAVAYAHMVGVEVGARRAAETALRESELRLRQFGEASQDVLWIRDAHTLQWEYLTPAFETVYGLDREHALRGDNLARWLDLVVPEDREHAADSLRRVGGGERITFEYRVRRPADGQVRWMRDTDFPIQDASGRVARIGGVGHDVTELKRTEEALADTELQQRTLMDGIPQLVWRSSDEGLWTWSSPQWCAFTGQSQTESRGRGWLDVIHPDDHAATLRAWEEARPHGMLDAEYRVRRASDGAWVWHHTRSVPVRDADGRIVEWLGTSTDIQGLRELQERQRVLVAELQHRTRNLMGVVRSMSDKTARTSTDLSDFRARFRDRLDALARAQGLLSRLGEHDRVTFDQLVQAELSAMNGTAERVTTRGPAGVRLRSSTVQTLAMALHELATNAIKYGALGQGLGGRLAINWSLQPSGEDGEPWLHVDWRESGVAMPSPDAGPTGTGQGRELIEQALPYQLRARTSYVLGADGVHCTISIPVSASISETGEHD